MVTSIVNTSNFTQYEPFKEFAGNFILKRSRTHLFACSRCYLTQIILFDIDHLFIHRYFQVLSTQIILNGFKYCNQILIILLFAYSLDLAQSAGV